MDGWMDGWMDGRTDGWTECSIKERAWQDNDHLLICHEFYGFIIIIILNILPSFYLTVPRKSPNFIAFHKKACFDNTVEVVLFVEVRSRRPFVF